METVEPGHPGIKELAAQIQYLKVELDIARSKLPQRATVTAQERNRLVKFGARRREGV